MEIKEIELELGSKIDTMEWWGYRLKDSKVTEGK